MILPFDRAVLNEFDRFRQGAFGRVLASTKRRLPMKRGQASHSPIGPEHPRASSANTLASAGAPADKPVGQNGARSVDEAARHEMIAQAAYFLAERRGFAVGCELDDWLCAKAEIEAKYQPDANGNRSREDPRT